MYSPDNALGFINNIIIEHVLSTKHVLRYFSQFLCSSEVSLIDSFPEVH